MTKRIVLIFCVFTVLLPLEAKKSDPKDKPKWAKKDISDMNEADMERLYDQWEEDDEPLPPDELPEHLRPVSKINFSGIDPNDKEGVLKMAKKGKALMMFVSVEDGLTRDQTEYLTRVWQTSLWNNHVETERFLIDDNRAIFMFKDGSLAWDAKDFFIRQDKCKNVVLENITYERVVVKRKEKAFGPEPKPVRTAAKEDL